MADTPDTTRRGLIKTISAFPFFGAGVVAMPVAEAAAGEADDFITPERAAMKLGELMCAETAGLWRIKIDRESGFVVIWRDRTAAGASPAVMMDLI